MKIEITNRQKLKRINLKKLASLISKVLAYLDLPPESFSFLICDNRRIRTLNARFLGANCPTDVIAFSYSDASDRLYLGEVIVSVDEAVRACAAYKNSWQEELLLYCIHGMLHLVGYRDDLSRHALRMHRKEQAILLSLKPIIF